MVFEYLKLTDAGGSFWSLDFIARMGFWVFTGIALALVGYKITGRWGILIAVAAGLLLFLYNEGIIRV